MNRIACAFEDLKRKRKKALSVFLTAGYPSLAVTEQLILALSDCGVDFFEIGFPFSDPIADGPTIQKSSEAALINGITWKKVMRLGQSIRKKSQVPLILMSYANPLFTRGWRQSAVDLSRAGFDGVIIPDLVPEEGIEVRSIFGNRGLALIYLVAPTSPLSRIKKIAKASSGFLYCVSVTGVTGARKSLPLSPIQSFLKQVRQSSSGPLLLGFGISKPSHIHDLGKNVDGFIIASALLNAMEGKKGPTALIQSAKNFMIPFAKAISK